MDLNESSLVGARKCVLAIDPGLSGAVAKIGCGSFFCLRDFRSLTDIGRAVRDLAQGQPAPSLAVMEHVHAMPKQGVVSTFSFGRAAGAAEVSLGLFLPSGVPMTNVEPQRWQGFFRQVYGIPRGQEFDSRSIALKLFPGRADYFSRVLDHNSADAVLMAVWGLSRLQ